MSSKPLADEFSRPPVDLSRSYRVTGGCTVVDLRYEPRSLDDDFPLAGTVVHSATGERLAIRWRANGMFQYAAPSNFDLVGV